MTTDLDKRLTVSVKEVTELTGLGRSTILAAAYEGSLASILVGKRRLFRVDDIRRWLGEQQVGTKCQR